MFFKRNYHTLSVKHSSVCTLSFTQHRIYILFTWRIHRNTFWSSSFDHVLVYIGIRFRRFRSTSAVCFSFFKHTRELRQLPLLTTQSLSTFISPVLVPNSFVRHSTINFIPLWSFWHCSFRFPIPYSDIRSSCPHFAAFCRTSRPNVQNKCSHFIS